MRTPADIRAFAGRRYREVLAAAVTGKELFPLRIPLGAWPAEDLEQMKTGGDALRALAKEATGHGPTIRWTERNTRRFGRQSVPAELEFSTREDYLGFVGKRKEFEEFLANVAMTREWLPALLPWLAEFPHRVIEKREVWKELLLVCGYFVTRPMPQCYPREIRLPIGTKLIETVRGILRALLDHLLPESARTGSDDFHERFGLKLDEPAIRLRWLGEPPREAPVRLADFSAPVSLLAKEVFKPQGVVIVENKTTFLTLPAVLPGWLAILGNGNSVVICRHLPWLAHRPLLYWGDIDPAGLQILARLRTRWPQTESVLMDSDTLSAHASWQYRVATMPENFEGALTDNESSVYQQVSQTGLGLEQERVLQTHVDQVFESLRVRYPNTV